MFFSVSFEVVPSGDRRFPESTLLAPVTEPSEPRPEGTNVHPRTPAKSTGVRDYKTLEVESRTRTGLRDLCVSQ